MKIKCMFAFMMLLNIVAAADISKWFPLANYDEPVGNIIILIIYISGGIWAFGLGVAFMATLGSGFYLYLFIICQINKTYV